MRFFLDHDVPDHIADVLRGDGHSVLLLRDVLPTSAGDGEALSYALNAQAFLITCNYKDFLHLCAEREHYGVIIMRRRRSRAAESSRVLNLVRRAGETGLLRNINFA